MARRSLNDSGDWHTEHDDQDIRGWPVRREAGVGATTPGETTVGDDAPYVRDLIFDTESEMVETVVLDDGTEYPARDIEIGDGTVYLEGLPEEGTESATKSYEEARMRRREGDTATGFAAHEPAFREHHETTYAEGEGYGHYHPAYRLGYDYGIDDDYRNRDWSGVKSEVRRDYEEHYGEGTWDSVRDAAKHAFEHARAHRNQTSR